MAAVTPNYGPGRGVSGATKRYELEVIPSDALILQEVVGVTRCGSLTVWMSATWLPAHRLGCANDNIVGRDGFARIGLKRRAENAEDKSAQAGTYGRRYSPPVPPVPHAHSYF